MSNSSPKILMVVTYDVAGGDTERFEDIAGAHAAASDTYPGCLRFSVGRDIQRPGRYQLVELWENQELLDEHGASEAFRRTVAALGTCDITAVRPDRYEVA